MTQFGLCSDLKMTPQELNRVANLPEWTTVLEVMIKSGRADLAFRTTKQGRWNQRAQDRHAHQDFLEEHRGTGRFSGKYAPQPQHTELIWTMPWGCWIELEDKDVHCKEWECIIEKFSEEEADTTVYQIYGQREAFWQKSRNDRAFFLVECVKKSRGARFLNAASAAKI